jgi:hypothetical protein
MSKKDSVYITGLDGRIVEAQRWEVRADGSRYVPGLKADWHIATDAELEAATNLEAARLAKKGG